jgi:hypothetical protein
MEHFDVILVLARIALDAEGSRSVQQIERLRDLLKASDADQSAKLNRLLNRAGRKHTMAPRAMNEMRLTADAVRRQAHFVHSQGGHRMRGPSTLYPLSDRQGDRNTACESDLSKCRFGGGANSERVAGYGH